MSSSSPRSSRAQRFSRALSALAIGLMLSGAAVPSAFAAAGCTGGWKGSVAYTRSQSANTSKTEQRVSGRGTQTTDWSMRYEYAAQVAVRAGSQPGQSFGRANINLSSVSTETVVSTDEDICRPSVTPRRMSGNFVTQSEIRAKETGLEADVSVSSNSSGTYRVAVRLPQARGTSSGSSSSSYSGQCVPKAGSNNSLGATPTTIDGFSFSSSGQDRFQPADPNRLSGSHSETSNGVTETIRWDLRRCGADLRLVDVKFEDMRFPTWDAWRKIDEQTGTIDGNVIRITAVVANDGADEKSATIKFRDLNKGAKPEGGRIDGLIEELAVSVPAGEQAEVWFKWDSSGYAWYDDGARRLGQRFKAELEEGGKKLDDLTRELKVAPKPIVLVHGLWSNWKAWESWQNILTSAHSDDWKAFPVGQNAQHGRMNTGEEMGNVGPTNTIAQNAQELARYVEYAQKDRNAWHIDIVAHSMGGLISRRYIHASMPVYPDGKPQVQHLVMLGTPNMGSRCADLISAPLEHAGGQMNALRELRPSVAAQFNSVHTNRKGVEFSVLAGNPLPAICYMVTANDGVVAVPSALWTIDDNEQQSVLHTDMTGAAGFSSFVKKRVAIGPGAQKPVGDLAALDAMAHGANVAENGLADDAAAEPDFSKVVKLKPGQTTEVTIPVEDAKNFGLTFVAANKVSATLADDKGAVVGANLTGKPEASQLFRSLHVDRPITKGHWTLTLQNTDAVERTVVLSTWSNAG